MITIQDVADCMALPVAAYPAFPFERPQLLAYYELLKDLKIDKVDLLDALKEVLKTSHFFPTVALIREEVLRRPTYTAPPFDSLELANAQSIPMPDYVRELRESLKEGLRTHPVEEAFGDWVDSHRIAPNSDSASVEESSESLT